MAPKSPADSASTDARSNPAPSPVAAPVAAPVEAPAGAAGRPPRGGGPATAAEAGLAASVTRATDGAGGRPSPREGRPAGYDKYAFEPFAVTVDLAVFTLRPGGLHVLLVERAEEPYAGRWALPGGFVLPDESAGDAARRELAEETGLGPGTVAGLHLEQLGTYSEPERDPRMRVVSVAHTALVPDPPEPRGGGDAARAAWLPFQEHAGLAFDHDEILADAHDRVGAKLEYTCIATAFCPLEFTLGELQHVYESIWDTTLDRPNFRRKVLATPGFVEAVPGAARLTGGRGKPAALYRRGPAGTLHPPLLRPGVRP